MKTNYLLLILGVVGAAIFFKGNQAKADTTLPNKPVKDVTSKTLVKTTSPIVIPGAGTRSGSSGSTSEIALNLTEIGKKLSKWFSAPNKSYAGAQADAVRQAPPKQGDINSLALTALHDANVDADFNLQNTFDTPDNETTDFDPFDTDFEGGINWNAGAPAWA